MERTRIYIGSLASQQNKRKNRNVRRYENEDSGSQQNKRKNRTVRRYENEDSGSQQNKRKNRTVRRYEVGDSGTKQNKREDRTAHTYESTKMFEELTRGIDISASDDSLILIITESLVIQSSCSYEHHSCQAETYSLFG